MADLIGLMMISRITLDNQFQNENYRNSYYEEFKKCWKRRVSALKKSCRLFTRLASVRILTEWKTSEISCTSESTWISGQKRYALSTSYNPQSLSITAISYGFWLPARGRRLTSLCPAREEERTAFFQARVGEILAKKGSSPAMHEWPFVSWHMGALGSILILSFYMQEKYARDRMPYCLPDWISRRPKRRISSSFPLRKIRIYFNWSSAGLIELKFGRREIRGISSNSRSAYWMLFRLNKNIGGMEFPVAHACILINWRLGKNDRIQL